MQFLMYAGPAQPSEISGDTDQLPLESFRETHDKRVDTKRYGCRIQFSQMTCG